MNESLFVLGATSLLGSWVVKKAITYGYRVTAVSRQDRHRSERPEVEWLSGDLNSPPAEMIYSSAPIIFCAPSALASPLAERLIGASECLPRRFVLFSSMSAKTKQASTDPDERATARILVSNEQVVRSFSPELQTTILRPTLIYGGRGDRNVEYLARRSKSWGLFPVAGRGLGLRQPVHAEDLAAAALDVLHSDLTIGRTYELGGAEVISVRELISRTARANGGRARTIMLPSKPLLLSLRVLRSVGLFTWLPVGSFSRMGEDLNVDITDAIADFEYAPRRFQPPTY